MVFSILGIESIKATSYPNCYHQIPIIIYNKILGNLSLIEFFKVKNPQWVYHSHIPNFYKRLDNRIVSQAFIIQNPQDLKSIELLQNNHIAKWSPKHVSSKFLWTLDQLISCKISSLLNDYLVLSKVQVYQSL